MNPFVKGFLITAGALAALVVFVFAAGLVLDAIANYSGFADCISQRAPTGYVGGGPPGLVWRL